MTSVDDELLCGNCYQQITQPNEFKRSGVQRNYCDVGSCSINFRGKFS